MSDKWYREPLDLPPIDMFDGKWTWDGRRVGPEPEPVPSWLAQWPEDLREFALQAVFSMDLAESYRRHLSDLLGC